MSKDVIDVREQCEQLSAKLTQIRAQLHLIVGEGSDAFHSMSDEIQNHFLWGVSDGVDAARDLANNINDALCASLRPGS